MLTLSAGYVGDFPAAHVGQPVEFPDFHGRPVTGSLESARPISPGVSVTLTVDGKDYGVFANTIVEVGN